MLGLDALGKLAIGQFTQKNTYLLPFGQIVSSGTLTGVPSSNYKTILSQTQRRVIFAAEISPYTLS